MRTSEPSDPELLAEWLEHRREAAFHELVARYAGLVHATALRTCSDDSLAAEASQLTFILLARKAKSLASCPSLGGWLHRSALLQAKNLLRGKRREQRKLEQLAMEPHPPSQGESWREIQPALDESLAALSAKDREALLLRFYRALSVREVAETLGIATDAAQKRIDRATGRLRAKILRGGCRAGGSLAATMLAGFAADAQAATLSVSVLASKAIAAGSVSTGSLANLTAVWTKPFVIATAALAVSVTGTWFTLNSRVKADQQIADTETAVLNRRQERNARRTKQITPHDKPAPIDWRAIGMQLLEARETNNQAESTRLWNEIIPRIEAMSASRLSSSLNEIAVTKMPPDCRILLEDMLLDPLRQKRPDLVLNRYFYSVLEPKCYPGSPFPMALQALARNNPYAAADWLDLQIAKGSLDRMASDDKFTARIELEASVMRGLMPVDFAAALDRLRALPNDQRALVLSRHTFVVPDTHQREYADFARSELPQRNQIDAIIAPITDLSLEDGYSPASEYMDRIHADLTEREACIEKAASHRLLKLAMERNITRSDFDELREWVSREDPVLAEIMTGKMLGRSTSIGGSMVNHFDFENAATIACEYQRLTGDDAVLYHFLDSRGNAPPQRVKELALKITDPRLRNSILSDQGTQADQGMDTQRILQYIEQKEKLSERNK